MADGEEEDEGYDAAPRGAREGEEDEVGDVEGGQDPDADARSEESFQSADDDDDFDLPQDLGLGDGEAPPEEESAPQASPAAGSSSAALPPGFDDNDGAAPAWNLKTDGNKEQLEPIWTRLSAEREHIKISKMFSYVLRHAAHKLDVRIRKDGFVRLREIMKLRNFKPYNLEELMAVVYFDEKERYTMVREFDGELLIRANQGHTMKVVEDDKLLEVVTDVTTVAECVHGTYLVHWPFIKRQGLSKVARNHIHLANGLPEDGKIRGMRQSAELFVYVDVPRAMDDGVVFYRSKNEVILTQGLEGWLPPKYFVKAVRIDYNTCEIDELDFDRGADMPQWPAELAPSGPGDQGTYLIKNLEALISNCKKRLQEINELKALAEQGRELSDDDVQKVTMHAQVHTELQSLEQRFRQHKGHRKESLQERDQRMKDEAEATTVVKRKDRAVTPPWEKGRDVSTASMKASEKEKAEWAALGRRRDTAPTPTAKKEDPWATLGRGRHDATPSAGTSRDMGKKPSFKMSNSFGPGKEDGPPVRREESWRFRGDDHPRVGREESKSLATPSNAGGPPRFINSKKGSDAPSWRDRMGSGHGSKDFDEGPGWRKGTRDFADEPRAEEPAWRSAPPQSPQVAAPSQPPQMQTGVQQSMAAVPPPPAQAPSATGMSSGPGEAGQYMAQAQMWHGGQMYGGGSPMCGGYGPGGQQVYYMPSPHGQEGNGMSMGSSWQHQMMQQVPQQQQQQMQPQQMQQQPQQMQQQQQMQLQQQQQMQLQQQQMPQQHQQHMQQQHMQQQPQTPSQQMGMPQMQQNPMRPTPPQMGQQMHRDGNGGCGGSWEVHQQMSQVHSPMHMQGMHQAMSPMHQQQMAQRQGMQQSPTHGAGSYPSGHQSPCGGTGMQHQPSGGFDYGAGDDAGHYGASSSYGRGGGGRGGGASGSGPSSRQRGGGGGGGFGGGEDDHYWAQDGYDTGHGYGDDGAYYGGYEPSPSWRKGGRGGFPPGQGYGGGDYAADKGGGGGKKGRGDSKGGGKGGKGGKGGAGDGGQDWAALGRARAAA